MNEREAIVAMLEAERAHIRRFMTLARSAGKTQVGLVLGVQDQIYSEIMQRIARGDHLKGQTDDR